MSPMLRRRAFALAILLMTCVGGTLTARANTITLVGYVVGSGSDAPDNQHAMLYSGYYTVTFDYTVATKKNGSGDYVFDPTGTSTVTITETGKFGGFTTLPITVTSADVSPGDGTVAGFMFSSTDWYPNAASDGITNNGLTGSIDLVQLHAAITSSYIDSNTKSVYTYNFATSPEPSTWLMCITGFGMVGVCSVWRRRGSRTGLISCRCR
jgi:hypothetical protein